MPVKQRTWLELLSFVVLVASCAAVRVALRDLPNFAPVAAVALFAGYFFRSALVAACVPLSAMAISDVFVGGYQWQMMVVVYTMLALPVAVRGILRRHCRFAGEKLTAWKPVAQLMGCSLAASILFYLVTNFGCWVWYTTYEHSFAGLLNCYTQALLFFRYTLAGDMVFAFALFGGYALAVQWAQLKVRVAQPERS
jgi:hypothetical protein